VADIRSKSDIQSVVAKVETECGRLDVLVNNACVFEVLHKSLPDPHPDNVEALQSALLGEDTAGWAHQFEINATSSYFTTVAFLHLLIKSNEYWKEVGDNPWSPVERSAQVITTVGTAAHASGMRGGIGYAASKAAQLHVMKHLSVLLTPLEIRFVRVSIICSHI